jgi:hypothetical protein
LLLDFIVAPSMKFTELDRRARLKKQCAKQDSIDRNRMPPLLNKKLQKQCAPQLQIALYSRPKAFHSG